MALAGRRAAWLALLLLVVTLETAASAQPTFPPLSGRVVDGAGMLGSAAEQRLSGQLEAHERATGNQIVVVTLDSLQGYTIEEYGYQLGRHWGIGEKGKDNGVVLIIAPNERKVRIEVGYGLEGDLTDAISANIIHARILPDFKAGRFEDGVEDGVTAIIQALGGEYRMAERAARDQAPPGVGPVVFFIFIVVAFLMLNLARLGRGRRGFGSGYYGGRGYGGGGFGGGGFGGGFSGGGGGFGGGGASGGW